MSFKVIVSGKASGVVLKTQMPINFLGSVDKKTGVIIDSRHELAGKSIKDRLLVFPHGVGSSVGAYTIYSLKTNKVAPAAMICKKVDLTVASGCALADIPLVIIGESEFSKIKNGQRLNLHTEKQILN